MKISLICLNKGVGERMGQMDKLKLKWLTAHLDLADWKYTLVLMLILSECKRNFFLKHVIRKPRRFMVMTKV